MNNEQCVSCGRFIKSEDISSGLLNRILIVGHLEIQEVLFQCPRCQKERPYNIEEE